MWFQTNSLNSNLWCDFKPFLRVWFQTKSVNSHSWFDFTLFVSLSWRVWFQTKSVNSNSWCDFTLFMSLNSNQWFEIKLFFLVVSWTAVSQCASPGLDNHYYLGCHYQSSCLAVIWNLTPCPLLSCWQIGRKVWFQTTSLNSNSWKVWNHTRSLKSNSWFEITLSKKVWNHTTGLNSNY